MKINDQDLTSALPAISENITKNLGSIFQVVKKL
jgi:hypothetical protein